MIITISGDAGSGKSTIAKLVAKKLNYKHYSVGDFMRSIARKRNMTLLEVSKLAENDRSLDEELDDMQIELGKFEDHFVLDSRLGYHFIPNSFKVFLKVDIKEAARRILAHQRIEEQENITSKNTIKNIKERKISELHRYKKYYKLNPYIKKNYDLVIDTTKGNPENCSEKIITSAGLNKVYTK